MVPIVLLVKLAAIAFAGYDSLRARFFAGIGAVVSILYLTFARLASLLPPHPDLPLSDALERSWWLYPSLVFVLALGPMVFAFRAARGLREDDPRHRSLMRAGFGFLASVLIDAAILVLAGVGLLLLARGA